VVKSAFRIGFYTRLSFAPTESRTMEEATGFLDFARNDKMREE